MVVSALSIFWKQGSNLGLGGSVIGDLAGMKAGDGGDGCSCAWRDHLEILGTALRQAWKPDAVIGYRRLAERFDTLASVSAHWASALARVISCEGPVRP